MLARLLLYLLRLFQLDRKLFLLLVASPMSACIIPVGPEFQDPIGVPNSPPFIVSTTPLEGAHTGSTSPSFSVTPADINVLDPLYVRWISEFPDYSVSTRIVKEDMLLPSQDGSELRRPTTYDPSCASVDARRSTHPILVAISDRPWVRFVTSDDLLEAEQGAHPVVISWVWEQTCMAPP